MKTTRSELRNRIMTILYQISVYESDKIDYNIEDVIKENDKENNKFVTDIVYGVLENKEALDALINKYIKTAYRYLSYLLEPLLLTTYNLLNHKILQNIQRYFLTMQQTYLSLHTDV